MLVVEDIFLADLEFRRFPWDLTQKRDSTRDEKTEGPTNDGKATAAKPVSGEGVEPTYTMTDMRIKGRAARSESMLLMRRLQSIGRRPVPTKSKKTRGGGCHHQDQVQ